MEAEEVLEVAEDLEEDLETEDLQEVIKGIGQDLMAEGVLTGQGLMDMAVHPDTGQDHPADLRTDQDLIAEEVLQDMEDQGRLEGVTRIHKLLLN